jgi:hypothetical protein
MVSVCIISALLYSPRPQKIAADVFPADLVFMRSRRNLLRVWTESSNVGEAQQNLLSPGQGQEEKRSSMTKLALTGIKPTGTPHLGNYLGMIKPALELVAHLRHFTLLPTIMPSRPRATVND